MNNPMDRTEILQMLFHPRREQRTQLPEGARDIDIQMAPEVTIGCRLHAAATEDPVILFFHGNGETVGDYDPIAPSYQRLAINFLVTDFRGYGWSTGQPLTSTLLPDAETLYRELRTWLAGHGFTGPFFLMGRSLGSSCAIDLASRHNDEISGLIIESGFGLTLPLAESLGLDLEGLGIGEEETFNNLAKMEQITRPTLILHGREDSLIPLWQAEKLMAASGARAKELQVVPGADHNSLIAVGGPLYFQTIRRFMDKATGENDWRSRRRAFRAGEER